MHMTMDEIEESLAVIGPKRRKLSGYLATISVKHFRLDRGRRKVGLMPRE